MQELRLGIIIWITMYAKLSSQTCLFGFERDEELGDFNTTCDGDKSESWMIVNRPESPPAPPDAGLKVLTSPKDNSLCMVSKKQIVMKPLQMISILIYVKRLTEANSGDLVISLICPPSPSQEWRVLDRQGTAPQGTWLSFYQPFSLQETNCNVQIELFHTGDYEVYVDQIIIQDPVSSTDDCYVVPRPTTQEDTTATEPVTQNTSESTREPTPTDSTAENTSDGATTNGASNSQTTSTHEMTGPTSEGTTDSNPTSSEENGTPTGSTSKPTPTDSTTENTSDGATTNGASNSQTTSTHEMTGPTSEGTTVSNPTSSEENGTPTGSTSKPTPTDSTTENTSDSATTNGASNSQTTSTHEMTGPTSEGTTDSNPTSSEENGTPTGSTNEPPVGTTNSSSASTTNAPTGSGSSENLPPTISESTTVNYWGRDTTLPIEQMPYPEFSSFFWVVIIAVTGVFPLLTLGLCWWLLLCQRRSARRRTEKSQSWMNYS